MSGAYGWFDFAELMPIAGRPSRKGFELAAGDVSRRSPESNSISTGSRTRTYGYSSALHKFTYPRASGRLNGGIFKKCGAGSLTRPVCLFVCSGECGNVKIENEEKVKEESFILHRRTQGRSANHP